MTLFYDVVRAFKATEAISGRERLFEPGFVISCDTGQSGPTLTFEAHTTLFLVDRSTFKTCCKFKNDPIVITGD